MQFLNKECIIILFFMIILTGCQINQETPEAFLSEKNNPISILVSTNSQIQLKRGGWKNYQPASFGAHLYPTDLIKSDEEISILCSDMQTVSVFQGTGRTPCPLPTRDDVLVYDGMVFESGARGLSSEIPYIIYPRNTIILEIHPELRWHDIEANSYTVEIRQGTNLIWKNIDVRDTSIKYPDTAPLLSAGKEYSLIVYDNDSDRSSLDDSNVGLGFQLLDGTALSILEEQKTKIYSVMELAPIAQGYALAVYYSQTQIEGRGIWGEAMVLLEQIARNNSNSPAVHLQLGYVLGRMKLYSEAEDEYKVALEQARLIEDLESQGEAFTALWHITKKDNYYTQAVEAFSQLGDMDRVKFLAEER